METKPSPALSLFLGSLDPGLAADRVGVLSQGVASSSELSRGCLEAPMWPWEEAGQELRGETEARRGAVTCPQRHSQDMVC